MLLKLLLLHRDVQIRAKPFNHHSRSFPRLKMAGSISTKPKTRRFSSVCKIISAICAILAPLFLFLFLDNIPKSSQNCVTNISLNLESIKLYIYADNFTVGIKNNCTQPCLIHWSPAEMERYIRFFRHCFQLNLQPINGTVCARGSEITDYTLKYHEFEFRILNKYLHEIILNKMYIIAINDFKIFL